MELGDSATMTVPPGALRHCRTSNYTGGEVEAAIDQAFPFRHADGPAAILRTFAAGPPASRTCVLTTCFLCCCCVSGLLSSFRQPAGCCRFRRTGAGGYCSAVGPLGHLALAERQESGGQEQQGQGDQRSVPAGLGEAGVGSASVGKGSITGGRGASGDRYGGYCPAHRG